MFPNWTGWKTLKLILTAVGAGAGVLAASPVVGPTVQAIAAVTGVIDASTLAVVIVLSGTSAGPEIVRKDV
jgi:hypothetical protein